MLTLYHALPCPFCARTRFALKEKGIPYQSIVVDLYRPPEFLEQLNPKGLVPILKDQKFVVYESQIINEYIEDLIPEPALIPKDPQTKARIRMYHDFANESIANPSYALLYSEDANVRHSALVELILGVNQLANDLEGKEFLLERFSMADIAFAPWAIFLDTIPELKPALTPALQAWIDRLRLRPSIANDPILESSKAA